MLCSSCKSGRNVPPMALKARDRAAVRVWPGAVRMTQDATVIGCSALDVRALFLLLQVAEERN
jgi:hypothetical protein